MEHFHDLFLYILFPLYLDTFVYLQRRNVYSTFITAVFVVVSFPSVLLMSIITNYIRNINTPAVSLSPTRKQLHHFFRRFFSFCLHYCSSNVVLRRSPMYYTHTDLDNLCLHSISYFPSDRIY